MQGQEFEPIPRFHKSIWDDLEAPMEAGVDAVEALPEPLTYEEPCAKCRGSGQFRRYSGRVLGRCLACKGSGKKVFRSSPAQRGKAQAWKEANPTEAQWIAVKASSFGFAQAMADALLKYGALTENQMATVQRLCAADAERAVQRAVERSAAVASAPQVSIEPIEKAFQAAREAGKSSLRLRLAGFVFKPAPASGVNAGAIYVTQGEAYLGKIAQGRFLKVRSCEAITEAEVVKVASDPKAEAIAYGRRTGSCACCGRELTNAESIALGIGPICAGKFGW